MLFVVVSGPNEENAKQTIVKTEEYADGYEFRLDLMEKVSLMSVKLLTEQTVKPIIFTLRLKSHGGEFEGNEVDRKCILNELLELNPDYVDLELGSDLEYAREVSTKFPRTQIICSYHNFDTTPSNLESIFSQMLEFPGVIFKIATKVPSIIDALALMTFIKNKTEDGHSMIGIGMGEHGHVTRILGPVFGNVMNFAVSRPEEVIAPGQLTAEKLCNTYHFKQLNQLTKIYGLIGNPVQQSPSDITHNHAIEHLTLNAVYVKMMVKGEELKTFMSMIKNLSVKGLSVTIPLKEDIGEYVQEIDDNASRIGAINTLIFKDNGDIRGENTDCAGALDVIESKTAVKEKKVLILGAGGSARAIAFESIKRGAEVIVVNRSEQRAKDLAADLGCRGFGITLLEEVYSNEGYDILINATSVGMYPNVDEIPINPEFILPKSMVMDIITRPKKTRLIEEALKKKCHVFYGYEMFVSQAVLQFEHWFGKKVSKEKLKKLLEKAYLTTQA